MKKKQSKQKEVNQKKYQQGYGNKKTEGPNRPST